MLVRAPTGKHAWNVHLSEELYCTPHRKVVTFIAQGACILSENQPSHHYS